MTTLHEERVSGALWALLFREGVPERVSDRDLHRCVEVRDGWSWMHFALSDQRARKFIARFEALPAEVREVLAGEDARVQMRQAGEWIYGVMPDLERTADPRERGEIGRLFFALSERHLITARRHALQGVDDVRRALEAGRAARTPAALFVMLVERFIDLSETRRLDLVAEADSIEDRALAMRGDPSRLHVGPLRREASRLHREFMALRAAFQRALAPRDGASGHSLAPHLPGLIQQLEDFDRDAADLLERARLLHEEIGEQISAVTNRSLRALTTLSVLMMPPTLVVGAFGMNLEGIPWAREPSGFWPAALLCVVVVAGAYLALKRFNVLR